MATAINPALLNEREARLYLGGISKTRLYRLLREPVAKRARVQMGRSVRYRLRELDRIIEAMTKRYEYRPQASEAETGAGLAE